jgi:hypothetical protein
MARRQAFAASARLAMPREGSVIVTKSSPDLAGADGSHTESSRGMGASVANVWTTHAAAGKACRQREELSPPLQRTRTGAAACFPRVQNWTPRLRDGTQSINSICVYNDKSAGDRSCEATVHARAASGTPTHDGSGTSAAATSFRNFTCTARTGTSSGTPSGTFTGTSAPHRPVRNFSYPRIRSGTSPATGRPGTSGGCFRNFRYHISFSERLWFGLVW